MLGGWLMIRYWRGQPRSRAVGAGESAACLQGVQDIG
jgi:hypothetical protein